MRTVDKMCIDAILYTLKQRTEEKSNVRVSCNELSS